MKLLILGGTGFVGRAVIDEARTRGHHITVLNRGHRPPPPGVTTLTGDRTTPGGLAALTTGTWDLVIDTWSAAPRAVRDSAHALTGRAGHYTYVSSRSVYTGVGTPPLDEQAPVVDASPDAGDDVAYPEAKRGAEIAARHHFDGPVLLARAGLILGPREDVGRLPWWLRRLAAGGPTLAPGPHDLPLQYIDARDLAAFLLDAATDGRSGAYNLVSPPGHTTMGELLELGTEITGGRAELRWTSPEAILAAGLEPWTELPIWLPPGPDHEHMHRGDVRKALGAGLRLRPVRETVADTWAWVRTLGDVPVRRADRPAFGLDPAREALLLT